MPACVMGITGHLAESPPRGSQEPLGSCQPLFRPPPAALRPRVLAQPGSTTLLAAARSVAGLEGCGGPHKGPIFFL